MRRFAWLATIPLLALPALALAADGYTTGNVNLRAGPDVGYPLVDTIPAGAPVDIEGCTSGWAWCDVVFQGERGWVVGNFIQYEYGNQNVLVPQYGAQIGIPIVTFVISTYWNDYYRNRPFYRERTRWYSRPMPYSPPPPPMRHPMPPRRGPMAHPAPRPMAHAAPHPMPQQPQGRPTPWHGGQAAPGRPQGHAPAPAHRAGPPAHGAARPAAHGKPAPKNGKDDHHGH